LINKLDTKRSKLPLDDARVFTFPLNLRVDYKSIPSFYASSLCSSLSWPLGPSWLFRALYCCSPQLSSALIYNAGLQSLFIGFYNITLIWTMRCSWPLDAWRILINPIRSWSSWCKKILNPLIFRNKSLLNKNWILFVLHQKKTCVWKRNWFCFRKCLD